jgi:tetratricopeptide (TPR) repeat protein
MCFDRNYNQAFRQIKHALQLNPRLAGARSYYSICLAITGKHEESIDQGKKALDLDPLTPMAWINLGGRYYYARKYELCVENVMRSLEIDPEFTMTHYYLAYFYSQMKMYNEALSEIHRVFRAFGRQNTQFLAAEAIIKACSGDHEGAESVVDEIMALSKEKYASSFWLATIYVTLGRADKAFEYFKIAWQSREVLMIFLNVDPVFDPVRHDPRFTALLEKMNFI